MRSVEKGIVFSIAACACYAFAAFLIKILSLSFPLIVFTRNLIGFCVFLPFFLTKKEQLKTKRLPFHSIRSCLSLASIYCSTWGIQHLNLGDAILLELTAPFFILAILFLGKGRKVSFPSVMATCVAFIGVGYILKPHFDVWQVSALASLSAGFLVALSIVCMESLAKTEPPLTTLFYFLWVSSLLSIGPAMGCWREITSLYQGMMLFFIGIFFALFQFLLTCSLKLANADVIGSYTFSTAVFSIVLGVLFLGEELSFSRMVGSLLILGAGLYLFYEKRKSAAKKSTFLER